MKKRSRFWGIPTEVLAEITKDSNSIAEIIRKCEMISSGASYKILKKRLNHENINYSHIKLGLGSNTGRNFTKEKIPLEKVLIENSEYNRANLKKRLVSELGWKEECAECENKGEWRGKKLILQLDHVNGNSKDNRIENLRFLCPNCHSQTDTFSGKIHLKNKCQICKNKVSNKNSKYCTPCFVSKIAPQISINQRKTTRPTKEVILDDIANLGYRGTGRKYSVSDNTIRKWIK
jgi:Zn finger protein HypA/HybF involved in hydrogenase expression